MHSVWTSAAGKKCLQTVHLGFLASGGSGDEGS